MLSLKCVWGCLMWDQSWQQIKIWESSTHRRELKPRYRTIMKVIDRMKRRTRTDWIITNIQGMKAWILVSIESRVQTEAGQRLREFCQVNTLLIANTLFQQHKRRLYTWTSPDLKWNQTDYIFLAGEDGEALFSQQKQEWELTVAQIMNSLLPDSDLNWSRKNH